MSGDGEVRVETILPKIEIKIEMWRTNAPDDDDDEGLRWLMLAG